MLGQFLSWEQPCVPKNMDMALNIVMVERYPRKNLQLHLTLEAIRFKF